MEMREDSAAGSSGMEFAVAAGNAKPAGAKKKTKTVRVKQECIDALLARRPIKPYPFIPEESIQLMDPKKQEEMRALQARIAANIKVARDEEEDILEQYRLKGYAEVEVEVREGDDDMGN